MTIGIQSIKELSLSQRRFPHARCLQVNENTWTISQNTVTNSVKNWEKFSQGHHKKESSRKMGHQLSSQLLLVSKEGYVWPRGLLFDGFYPGKLWNSFPLSAFLPFYDLNALRMNPFHIQIYWYFDFSLSFFCSKG